MNGESQMKREANGLDARIENALKRAAEERWVERIWAKDASLWKSEPEHRKTIENALGWLNATEAARAQINDIKRFAGEVRAEGFTHLVLLGMGGSSLCPEVFRRTFGRQKNFPELLVLDSTDPETIKAIEDQINIRRTLFIVASKSGTTIEPLSFYKYFFARVEEIKAERSGENFIAITDPGTLMERTARERKFRRTFLNPPDIGGRFSALSLFGLVPAALMGIDVREMWRRAEHAVEECGVHVPIEQNAGALLGCAMGAHALSGRDKLTLITDDSIKSLGLWIEQLVGESTGKEGKGIVPVAGEPLSEPEAYGADRFFVAVYAEELSDDTERKLNALEAAGHPVMRREIEDGALSLGAEFFVWEMATAVAGACLQINPFDQPNVQESKDRTRELLEELTREGKLNEDAPLISEGELKVYGAESSRAASSESNETVSSIISNHLSNAREGDYFALLAYIHESDAHDRLLRQIAEVVRDKQRIAATFGYGPRYLHSTGQLHKGGADNGVFLVVTNDKQEDRAVPGEAYSFATLNRAQALGDFAALTTRGRRALRVHLGRETERGLQTLLNAIHMDNTELL
jgi:transaldolase / glucose-6-phosphate isomerase